MGRFFRHSVFSEVYIRRITSRSQSNQSDSNEYITEGILKICQYLLKLERTTKWDVFYETQETQCILFIIDDFFLCVANVFTFSVDCTYYVMLRIQRTCRRLKDLLKVMYVSGG